MAKGPSGYRVGNVTYGKFSGVTPRSAANENKTVRQRVNELKALDAESNKMLKEAGKDFKINSGKYAYGSKPESFAKSASKVAARGAGAVARGALRAAGPVGALVGMTEPAGAPEGHPAYESSTVKRTGSYGPVMKGNADQMRGSRVGPTQAPNRTAPSTSSPAKGKSSYGGGGRDSGGVSKSTPARGTERFAKGSLVKSKVNQAGTYTKPGMRKKMFESIKASAVQGTRAGQWSARKAQLLAKRYKASGGGYK